MEATSLEEQPSIMTQVADRLRRIRELVCNVSELGSENHARLIYEVNLWIQLFQCSIHQWTVSAQASKEEKQLRIRDSHLALLALDRAIATTDKHKRQILCNTMVKRKIDQIFAKLRALLRSVSVEKEIEVFEDMLECCNSSKT